MGKVAMESRRVGYDRGYPIVEATLYVYCDKCGSFNIKKHITLRKWILIALFLAVGVIAREELPPLIFCWILVVFFALPLWRDILISYKCRKCGNEHITDYNVLHHPPYDKSVVDVPDRYTQKRYIDDDVIGFSQYT